MGNVQDVESETRTEPPNSATIFRIAKRPASSRQEDDDGYYSVEQENQERDKKRQKGTHGAVSCNKGSHQLGLDEQWKLKYDTLVKFHERNGHTNVPQNYEMNGIKLGRWVRLQREQYRQKKFKQDRFEKLKDIGFEWHPTTKTTMHTTLAMSAHRRETLDAQWSEKFNLLKEYQKEHHHTNVPKVYKTKGVRLGAWVGTQRQVYREETIQKNRYNKLKSIGFKWNTTAATSTKPTGMSIAPNASPNHPRRAIVTSTRLAKAKKTKQQAEAARATAEAGKTGMKIAPNASPNHPRHANVTSTRLDEANKAKQRAEEARAEAEAEKTLAEAAKIQAEATLLQAQAKKARAEAKKMEANARKLEDEVARL